MSSEKNTPDEKGAAERDGESVDRARRRLMTLAVYVPPTVLAIIALQQAGCQVVTCGPSAGCNPGGGCNPSPALAPENPGARESDPGGPDNNLAAPSTGCSPLA